jgi:DNA-binding NarL/FixJ family response regulator
VGAAEARRALGCPTEAWQAAVEAAAPTPDVWLDAYARYRLGEALLGSHAPRHDSEQALGAAHRAAVALGAKPLIGWIETLARRARMTIEELPPDGQPTLEGAEAPDGQGLTSREREVLALVAEGYTNRRIAEALFISESTAGVHVSNILGKLGVASRTEAAAVATRLGLVS